jgi:hypothetical protein
MIKKAAEALLIFFLSFGVIFLANMAIDPSFSNMSLDGGVFAYCGQRIAQGALLYRDCWDNKPPAIYYLNATAIALGGARQWNLWLLQSIWLSLTTLAFYQVLKNIWSRRVALICTALFLLTVLYPVYFSGGNLTETYAMLPITLILGSFWRYLKTKRNYYLAGVGLFASIAFLFKPTYSSMGVGALIVLLFLDFRSHQYRLIPRQIGVISLSFMIPLLLTASYWVFEGDLSDLLFAIFTHNQLYVEQGFNWRALLATVRIFITEQPLAALFALAMISVLVYAVENSDVLLSSGVVRDHEPDHLQVWVMAGLIITFMFDFIFTTLPGTNFHHYFQIPILTLAVIAGYLVHRLSSIKLFVGKGQANHVIIYSAIIIILIPWLVEVVGKELPTKANWQALTSIPNITQYQPDSLEEFILANTTPHQSILIWDYAPAIYFHVDRRSPTRFIFLRHIFTPIPGASNGFAEFMQELHNDPPELIMSSKTSLQGLPYLGQDEDDICNDCPAEVRAGVVAFKQYVSQNYQAYIDIGSWAVYKKIK